MSEEYGSGEPAHHSALLAHRFPWWREIAGAVAVLVLVILSVSEGSVWVGGAPDAKGSPAHPRDDRQALLLGLWSSSAIGCRPQLALPILPMLAVALWRMRTNRQRVTCIATFAF